MKQVFQLLATLLLTLNLAGQNWVNFSDSSVLFTARYPSNWVNKIKEDKRVFFTSPADNPDDDFLENINVSVTINPDFGTKYKITDIMPGLMGGLKNSFTDFKEEGQRIFTWNNQDAGEIIYSGFNKANTGMRVRMVQWFCFYKTRLYTVTYTSKENSNKHNETARKIMTGIVFKE